MLVLDGLFNERGCVCRLPFAYAWERPVMAGTPMNELAASYIHKHPRSWDKRTIIKNPYNIGIYSINDVAAYDKNIHKTTFLYYLAMKQWNLTFIQWFHIFMPLFKGGYHNEV